MKWITRKNVKVDRVACPWLIKRFVDPQAEFRLSKRRTCLSRPEYRMQLPSTLQRLQP